MTTDELRATCERIIRAGDDTVYRASTGAVVDAEAVARAWLAEHPADSDQPVTAEWFESVGWWVNTTRAVAAMERGDLRVSAQLHNSVWHLMGRRVEGDCSLRCPTRGHVRRLLQALGAA